MRHSPEDRSATTTSSQDLVGIEAATVYGKGDPSIREAVPTDTPTTTADRRYAAKYIGGHVVTLVPAPDPQQRRLYNK